MGDPMEVSSIEMLDILVTSSINTFGSQRRFPKNISIGDLKQKLELLTGASSVSMELQLLDKNKQLVTRFVDDKITLGSYPIENNMCIHVVDSSLQQGEFEDVSKVKKFELTEEEYNKRSESLRAFKEKNKLGNFNEEEERVRKLEKEKKSREEEELIKGFSAGNRCEVRVTGQLSRKGTIMYIGKTDFKPGYWLGVKYDEPLGKNDGSVQGKRYFECTPKYGGFVKPQDVVIGDFPEEIFEDEI